MIKGHLNQVTFLFLWLKKYQIIIFTVDYSKIDKFSKSKLITS